MDSRVLLGRPKQQVNFGLILAYRERENLGWLMVAKKYTEATGEFISKQTCRRRYLEFKKINP